MSWLIWWVISGLFHCVMINNSFRKMERRPTNGAIIWANGMSIVAGPIIWVAFFLYGAKRLLNKGSK